MAVMEAMNAGVVPVASDLASGMRDLVTPGESGLLAPVGDVAAFTTAIGRLHHDRACLERLSAAARHHVNEHFDATACAAAYHDLFARHRALKRPRPAGVTLPYGTRLDRRWMPNAVVRAIRRRVHHANGARP